MSGPVLLVTNHAPPDRVGAFQALARKVELELLLFGGRSKHATAGVADPGVPHRHVDQSEVGAIVRAGGHRAVVASSVGRRALPAAWLGARRAKTPFVLWTALWAHPRTPAHAASYPLMWAIYRSADAIATYGSHVSAYVCAHGARGPVVVAPQAVDGAFWGAEPRRAHERFTAVFIGREAREKGLDTLTQAWVADSLEDASLVLIGVGQQGVDAPVQDPGVHAVGPRSPDEVRNFLRAADVLVIPSRRTAAFREPWGLVANEAMHMGIPVIASDETGAAAGGLVRHERNGLVVAADDPAALRGALLRLAGDTDLRGRLGTAAREDVAPYTYEAWADGIAEAIEAAG